MDFDKLYDGLWERVHTGLINVQPHSHLTREIYNYSLKCVTEGSWDQWTLLARGLVIDPICHRVIATPFPKFFNFGEISYDFPDEPFVVTEKMDGSLIIVFWHENQWHAITRGSFTSEQSQWATEWFRKHVDTDFLHPGYTYLFEVIYPENRIVVTYDFTGLVLLGGYNYLGDEIDDECVQQLAHSLGIKAASRFEFNSLDDISQHAKSLTHNHEGYVVRFQDGFRLKIKGDEYCRVHRLVSRITPLGVWDIMASCQDIDKVKEVLPEEFQHDFDNIYQLLDGLFQQRLRQLKQAVDATSHLSDKELGKGLQEGHFDLPDEIRGFIFPCRKGDFLNIIHQPGRSRTRFFRTFRPTANHLDGYRPSTLMNRFVSESE
jgi:RNA ligase